jgi:hypothetical protein
MCADPTLILFVSKTSWRLCLRVAVVVSRAVSLAWWGIAVAVVSSRRPGRVREGLLPLIHSESSVLEVGRGASQVGLLTAKLGEHKLSYRNEVVSKPPVIRERVATESEASQQRQMQPVEIQLRVNDAWRGGGLG